MKSPETNESMSDLELGKMHLQEMLERLSPLIQMDKEKSKLAAEIAHDLKTIESPSELQKQTSRVKELMDEISGLGPENKARRNQIHRELSSLEKGLKYDQN